VLGREFDLATSAIAAGMTVDEALDACDEAGRHGLVDAGHSSAGYRFVHALVQEAVAQSLPPGRAVRLHAAVAAELERTGAPVDQLAEHTWRARDLMGVRAVPHQLAAAQNAMSVLAHERAEQYLRRALGLVRHSTPPDPHTELTTLLSLFRLIAANRGWGAEDARELVARARELAPAGALHRDTVRLWWSLWLYLVDRDDAASAAEVAAARDELRAARAAADRAPNDELATFDGHLNVLLLIHESYVAALDGDAAGHRSAAESAIALADADGRHFPRAVARTLAATTAIFLRDPGYARQRASDALELSARFGFGWLEMTARCAAASAAAQLGGDTAVATREITEIVAQHREAGRVGNLFALFVMLAEVHRAAGQLDEARSCLQRARAHPGPFRALMVDHLDRRLRELG
jgi:hypothetical protein